LLQSAHFAAKIQGMRKLFQADKHGQENILNNIFDIATILARIFHRRER